MVLGLMVACCVVALVLTWGWKILTWLWLKPKKMEKYFRQQGITGPPYRFLYGSMKEMVSMIMEARSKPMELSHRIAQRILPFHHQAVQKYGKTFISWNGPTPRVSIMDPELIREIFANKSGHFAKIKGSPLGKLLAEGLTTYDGEIWGTHRRIINPAFHLEKLKMMLPEFNTSCSDLISKWHKVVSGGPCEVDVLPDLQHLTADVISRTAFGSSYEEGWRIFKLQTEQIRLFIQVVQSINIPGFRFLPTKRNRRMKEIYKEVGASLKEIISKREKAMQAGEGSKDDLLGILLESNYQEIKEGGNVKNVGMSLDEVIGECKLFYFSGQETTSTLLVWTMIVLSMHQEWQDKAREEVLKVFGRNTPDFEGLNQLKIITMILYEVLRLYSPAHMLQRATCKEIKVGDVVLPPGVELDFPILMVHHDPDVWGEDVEEFNPERFVGGIAKATNNQVSFFPFGWGPRICIGQTFTMIEAKIALSMILQNFEFELSPTYVHAPGQVTTIQPLHGAQLILHKL